jgi:hypothetical protein
MLDRSRYGVTALNRYLIEVYAAGISGIRMPAHILREIASSLHIRLGGLGPGKLHNPRGHLLGAVDRRSA